MLLAVDKPTGITSYDVIRRLKRLFPKQKIGHSGTLDPLATGLLIIGIGSGTKQLQYIQGLDKRYETRIDFSQTSDTWDVDFREEHKQYDVITQNNIIGIQKDDGFIVSASQADLEQKLALLVPEKELPLTPFSAKKINGKKMYDLARSGHVLTEKRVMKTFETKIISYTFPSLHLALHVGSGTYIRSIAYWLGAEFGLGGILTELRRTAIGQFDINELKLESLGDSDLFGVEIML